MAQQQSPEEVFAMLERAGVFNGMEEDNVQALREMAADGQDPRQFLRMVQRAVEEEQPVEKLLERFDLEGIAEYITTKNCQKIVVMCGAGISTSAGIPDFRSPGTGLYDNLQRFNLPRPEAIFEVGFFEQHPGAFYELAKEMWPGQYTPTAAHYFIRLLHEKGLLLRCYSQNIDSLEAEAGLPPEKLVAAHGNFDGAHVVGSDPEIEVDVRELKAAIDKGEEGWMALRDKYGGLVKPKIVFFGEDLPERFGALHRNDLEACDLLIVMGTSLVVHPFAGLVGMAKKPPRLLINREQAGRCEDLRGGFRFHQAEKNGRDVFHAGDCDGGCRELAAKLGYLEDLEALIESKGKATISRAPWANKEPEEPRAAEQCA